MHPLPVLCVSRAHEKNNGRPAGRIAASVSADLDHDGRRKGIRPGFY
jgi:hypothetical protein